MKELSDSFIAKTLATYGFTPDPEFSANLRSYVSSLLKWNKTISLTTVTDPGEILKFHFGESLFAASLMPDQKSRLADVGSGAGFPGFPLAMAFPNLHATLIESNKKKCAFLSEVSRAIGRKNVHVSCNRMEEIETGLPPFEIITARALGQFDELLSWAKLNLSASGRAILWLGEKDVADVSARDGWEWSNRLLIPGSDRRYLLAGSPRK